MIDRFSKSCVVAALLVVACPALQAGLKIYYMRHAETGANIADAWKDKPKETWPAYVGNSDTFSPKGWEQLVPATEKLRKRHFDFIAVSPAWRTRHTIAPYLKATGRKAEIWPELQEFAGLWHQHDTNLPAPSADLFTGGGVLKLTAADQEFFTLRPGGDRQFRIGKGEQQAAADRRAVVRRDIQLIQQRFGGTEKSILLVGHGNSGRIMLEELTGDPKLFETEPKNTGIWMVEQQKDGTFKAILLNDEPVGQAERVALRR